MKFIHYSIDSRQKVVNCAQIITMHYKHECFGKGFDHRVILTLPLDTEERYIYYGRTREEAEYVISQILDFIASDKTVLKLPESVEIPLQLGRRLEVI
jgi:hypothetical protein